MSIRSTYSALAFTGAFPFLACAALLVADITVVSPLGSLADIANSYGLAIICFLSGIHWSIYLTNQEDPPFNLLLSSNVVFLFVWITYILAGTELSLISQVAALVALLLIDRSLLNASVISSHYFRTRLVVTGLAASSLLVIVLN